MVAHSLAAVNAAEAKLPCPKTGKADNELQLFVKQVELESGFDALSDAQGKGRDISSTSSPSIALAQLAILILYHSW
jgi:hypothetical protein